MHIKISPTVMYILYGVVIACLGIYSFALVDPNITFVNHPLWEAFRNVMVQIGFHQRKVSWNLYLSVLILLTCFHVYFIKRNKDFNPLILAGIAGTLLLFSYPLLSHDLFNYMFDARIFTTYGANPYTHKALDFGTDPWLRFMHWTHRTYPYGPSFLIMTLVPSFLSFGKFLISFVLFKLMIVASYYFAIKTLQKVNNAWAVFFATSPIILIEGLVNAHNDMLAVGLAIIGIGMLMNKHKNIAARLMFLLSGGVKYFTLPTLFLSQPEKSNRKALVVALLVMAPILYISVTGEIQPWYYLNLMIFIPYFYKFIERLHIFFAGLLASYYPFITLGGWGVASHTEMKHNIILAAVVLQGIYLAYIYRKSFLRR